MDLTESPEVAHFRARARNWLTAHAPGECLGDPMTDAGLRAHLDWERALHDGGWNGLTWPVEYGGQGRSMREWLLFEEEYCRVGGPVRISQNGSSLLAPSLIAHGTEEQKKTILPRIASAEDLWAQGWSEPGAGSDLASVRSRAVRDDDAGGWRVTGHKTWSTRAGLCTHLFGLFRTDPSAARHRGLTYLMIDLDSDGVEVRPFARFDGQHDFADVFFDEVLVPDSAVIGDVGDGWRVAMSTTASERGAALRPPARYSDAVRRLARETPRSKEERRTIAALAVRATAYQFYTDHQLQRAERGQSTIGESSVNKLIWSELDIDIHEAAASLTEGSPLLHDRWTEGLMFSLGGPIYAGTNEIQRTIIAERTLGLPRGRGRV